MLTRLLNRLARTGTRRVLLALLSVGLLGTTAAFGATRATAALVVVIALLSAILAATTLDVRSNRIMIHDLRQQLAAVDKETGRTRALLAAALHDRSRLPAGQPTEPLPPALIPPATIGLLDRGDALDAYALASESGSIDDLPISTLRRLRDDLHRRGYLARALEIATRVEKLSGEEQDRAVSRRITAHRAVISGRFTPTVTAPAGGYVGRPGTVLHLVGRSLPPDQVGYTIRTRYTALAQSQQGLYPHVATHMGYATDSDEFLGEQLDGVTYHRLPGSKRGRVPLDQWLSAHVDRVAELVRTIRPAVLHAASDYTNALTARAVGNAYGIPVVYEVRGFWEESWLSRQAQQYGWHLPDLERAHGLPDEYLSRREMEIKMWLGADHVVTLADVMADHIAAKGVPRDRVTVVPNAVAAEDFPVLTRNAELAGTLSIGPDTTVIGYVSSLTEYEGIGTLIDAYASIRDSSPTPVALLIVGDGPARGNLARRAESLGLDVRFTGRVPHDQVLDYYGLIDVFVVPRLPATVGHLVTPLKPFEAFSTGRTVVLSDVRALASIAEESGAAETFVAGDAGSLSEVLLRLLMEPGRRKELAATGAAWVRSKRTWSANASTYMELYRRLGALPLPAEPDHTHRN